MDDFCWFMEISVEEPTFSVHWKLFGNIASLNMLHAGILGVYCLCCDCSLLIMLKCNLEL